MDMLRNKTQIIIGALAGTALILFLLSIVVGTAQGGSGEDYRIAENRETIYEAQINAVAAHESLAKAKQVVEAAVEAERKAQTIVDSYSNTARTARENICNLSKDACNNKNLDPAGQGINIDEFLQLAR